MTQMQMARLDRRLSQAALGRLVGLDAPTISQIESGIKHLWPTWRARIALALGVSPEQLLASATAPVADAAARAARKAAREPSLRDALWLRMETIQKQIADANPKLTKYQVLLEAEKNAKYKNFYDMYVSPHAILPASVALKKIAADREQKGEYFAEGEKA